MASSDRIFLLSPAKAGGPRYEMLTRPEATFDLALRVKKGTATIAEVYTFISGLYFRGKLAYANAFPSGPPGVPPVLVIVPGAGLVPPDTTVSLEELEAIAGIPVDEKNEIYRETLLASATLVNQHAGPSCLYVLLGSIASGKYISPLLDMFGDRLVFPANFVGRGDMSRGGLMLRHSHAKVELAYIPVAGAVRHGARPPRLERWRKP